MIELDNRTKLTIDEDFLNSISKSLIKKDIELFITTQDEIQGINN
jgi:hypothetical protein